MHRLLPPGFPAALLLLAGLSGTMTRAGAVELNQVAVHYKYSDGDFNSVIQSIEAFTKTHKSYARTDSIFIAKHLAVVYTANPETRERGKYYMFQLLDLVPSAELVDMYVSDEIENIFLRVRKEYDTHHVDVETKAAADREARKPFWQKPWAWAAGAAVAGVTVAILVWPEDKPRPEYVVP